MPGQPFSKQAVVAAKGDVFVLLTDGSTEVFDGADEEFGIARITQIVAEGLGDRLEAIADAVAAAARARSATRRPDNPAHPVHRQRPAGGLTLHSTHPERRQHGFVLREAHGAFGRAVERSKESAQSLRYCVSPRVEICGTLRSKGRRA